MKSRIGRVLGWRHWPKHGFRFQATDALVLFAGLAFGGWLLPIAREPAVLAICATLHFFLFCNVIRAPQRLELIWAALFVANGAAWMLGVNFVAWMAVQCASSLTIILLTVMHPNYRGVGCRKPRS